MSSAGVLVTGPLCPRSGFPAEVLAPMRPQGASVRGIPETTQPAHRGNFMDTCCGAELAQGPVSETLSSCPAQCLALESRGFIYLLIFQVCQHLLYQAPHTESEMHPQQPPALPGPTQKARRGHRASREPTRRGLTTHSPLPALSWAATHEQILRATCSWLDDFLMSQIFVSLINMYHTTAPVRFT